MLIANPRFHRLWAGLVCLVATPGVPGLVRSQESDSYVGDPYPLANCVMMDTPLDERAVVFKDRGREVRVCCRECKDRFVRESFVANAKIDEQLLEQQRPLYPLAKCIVDDKRLEANSTVELLFRNRLFRLCSDRCRGQVEKEPAKFFGKLDFEVIEKQKSDYPLRTCVVSGKPLSDKSYDHVVANRLVRLASVTQVSDFDRTPGQYLEKLREAAEQKAKAKK